MSRNTVGQVRELADGQFCAADDQDPRQREQALWSLESAFGVLLDELDRGDTHVVLNRQTVTERLLHALDGGQVRRRVASAGRRQRR